MKKLAFFVAAFALLLSGCNDDLEDELNELKDKVDNLENALVTGLEFQGNNLVVLFSDGTTSQVTVPAEVLPGNVVNFDIDNESGTISITFADGTKKEYLILNNGYATYLSGILEGDYGIASVKLGDVEMLNMGYDGQNRVVSALVNLPDGYGNVVNVMELQHNYAGANPTIMGIEKSLRHRIDTSTESWLNSSHVYFDTDRGLDFVEKDGEMYNLFINPSWTGSEYRYTEYKHCWFVSEKDVNHSTYMVYHPVPGEDSLFYVSDNNYRWMVIDGVSGRLYYPYRIVKVNNVYQPGEAIDTSSIKLTMRNDDLIEKMEYIHYRSGEVTGYWDLTYDENALLTKINMFEINRTETDSETINFGRTIMTYTGELLNLVQFESLDNEGNVEETFDITKFVYDEVGNPVEIWAIPFYDAGDGYKYITDENGKIIIEELEMVLQKVVGIEYNYTLPNFFGKTLEYMIPELKGIQVKNAPVRLTQSGFFNFVNMEYFDFNQGGYPAKVKVDSYLPDFGRMRKATRETTAINTELLIDYVHFE